MPWLTPTLRQTREMVRDDVTAALSGAIIIGNNVLRVVSDAMAGLAHLVLRYIDWLALQLLPDTAEKEWLDRHAAIWLVNADGTTGRKAATPSAGSASFIGTPLAILPQFSQLTYGGDQLFEALEEVTIDDTGAGFSPIRAITYGAASNLPTGTQLNVAIPPVGIESSAFVVDALTGGTNVESDYNLRIRVLLRIREPPMGGDAMDYVLWALAVPGVTRAWCAPLEQGIGTVTVRFMCDELRATDDPLTNGFPLPEDIAAVRAYLDKVRPVTTKDFQVVAPIPEPIDFRILNLIEDNASTRGAIEISIDEMLREKAAPAYSLGGIIQPAQTIYETWVSCAVLASPGVQSFDLEMQDHIMPTNGSLAVRGTIMWG